MSRSFDTGVILKACQQIKKLNQQSREEKSKNVMHIEINDLKSMTNEKHNHAEDANMN